MIEVVHTLSLSTQQAVLAQCRAVVQEAPLFQKVMPTGAKFRYLCTSAGQYGWMSDKRGYRYVEAHPITNTAFPAIPQIFQDIAVDAAEACGMAIRPETALINWYDANGQLGLHQDKTEISRAPVVSISIGDDCVFIIGGENRTSPKRDIILKSGDVLVMGAEHRLIFHGVRRILPSTAPPELGLKQPGRVNITIRQVYD